ncbi:MAG: hypothetical protein PUE12_03345 [Oscillospiraceae bacterium]|nr:hypothetical protein [Oscillospiraceae bacterium]
MKDNKAIFIRDAFIIIAYPVLMIVSVILTVLFFSGIINNKSVLYILFFLWLSISIFINICNLIISTKKEKDVLKMQYFNKLRDSKKYKMFCIISFIAGFGVLSYTIFYLIIDI